MDGYSVNSLLNEEALRAGLDDSQSFAMANLKNFPGWARDIVGNVSSAYQVCTDFVSFPLMTAVGTLVGKRAYLNDGKFINYPQLWTILVAPPATGKTEPVKWIYQPLRKIQKQMFADKDANGDVRYLLLNDSTIEARNKVLANNPNGIGLIYDEFAEYLNNIGRYGKNGEIANMLSIFSNSSFSITRKCDAPLYISSPFMSLMGGIQPGVLSKILGRAEFSDNGFITRFLWVRSYRTDRAKYEEAAIICNETYNKWMGAVDFFNGLPEQEYTLSEEASAEYAKYYNGNSLEDDEKWQEINGKGEIISMRLALVIHLLYTYERYLRTGSCAGMEQVSLSAMKAAISIVQYASMSCAQVIDLIGTGGVWSKRDAICAMFANGIKQADIARLLKVSPAYVCRVVGDNRLTG